MFRGIAVEYTLPKVLHFIPFCWYNVVFSSGYVILYLLMVTLCDSLKIMWGCGIDYRLEIMDLF